jgi:hypothetical protein
MRFRAYGRHTAVRMENINNTMSFKVYHIVAAQSRFISAIFFVKFKHCMQLSLKLI